MESAVSRLSLEPSVSAIRWAADSPLVGAGDAER
jgi:hypothetical protein